MCLNKIKIIYQIFPPHHSSGADPQGFRREGITGIDAPRPAIQVKGK